jgi:hypothetical protein
MDFQIQKSTQFKINELVLVTKGGAIDITPIFEEISIFDSLLMPVMSGNILISDSLALSNKLSFDGSESILIDISKDANSDIANFKKAFRIYKQSDRKTEGLNEKYVLHFVADEFMYSDQQRVNQSFNLTYSEAVEKILNNYLKVPANNLGGVYENSYGVRNITIPNLRPLEAIEWIAKRAVDINQSPNFMFFQNLLGYNFASLSTLLTQDEVLNINFSPKNLQNKNAIDEISSARGYEVVSQTDSIKKTREGVNAGQFIGFDPMTRTIAKKNISYGDHYSSMKHGNETAKFSEIKNRDGLSNSQAFDSKKTVNIFGAAKQLSSYIKQNDPTSLSKVENYESFLFQRKAILANLMEKRIKVAMPGNFQLTSGLNVNVDGVIAAKIEHGDSNEDTSLSGKYLIIASRQIIGYNKHETIIEIATTSTNKEFIESSDITQTTEILEY